MQTSFDEETILVDAALCDHTIVGRHRFSIQAIGTQLPAGERTDTRWTMPKIKCPSPPH